MRYAICNELFEGWDNHAICQTIANLGYQGLEIAPFTLAPRITDFSPGQREQYRKEAAGEGIQLVGLHWLLAKTKGLHLTSPDAGVRQKTAAYLVELAQCCHDLGGSVLVLGSPAQRRIPEGHTREQAGQFALDTLERAIKGMEAYPVKLCLEPLSPPEADFINTCGEALEIIRALNHPQLVLHQDVKAMSTETVSTPELIRQYAHYVGHFHANDPNLRGPGFGDTDFVPIFKALVETGYSGWVSVEVFDFSPDPQTIARDSIRYMRQCESQVGFE